MAIEYKEPTFKKMVTTYGFGEPFKVDLGFAETIRWIRTKWSRPTYSSLHDGNRENIIVRMKDGEVKKLCYGSGRDIAAEYATHDVMRIDFTYDEEKEITTLEELRDFAARDWWYEEDYEDEFSCGEYAGTTHVYTIYEEPEYYLEYQIGDIPKDDDLEEEYWEYEDNKYVLKSEPCPYD